MKTSYMCWCLMLVNFVIFTISHLLLLSGARVVLACRDVEKGKEAACEITESTKNKNVVCYKLDLASFQSIKDFVTEFKQGDFTSLNYYF